MADPFSIVAGAIGIADVIVRVISLVRAAKDSCDALGINIEDISCRLNAIQSASDSVRAEYRDHVLLAEGANDHVLTRHWESVAQILTDSKSGIERLEKVLLDVVGPTSRPGRRDTIRRAFRFEDKDSQLQKSLRYLEGLQKALTNLLQAILLAKHRGNRVHNQRDHESTAKQLADIHNALVLMQTKLTEADANSRNQQSASPDGRSPFNKHFAIPQTVSNIFTGRQELLDQLESSLIGPLSPGLVHTQRRLVVSGLGGSGKTQLSCKLAQDFRESFWGVFYIDASTQASVREAFCRIAKTAGMEPNESAAKHWLANLEQPWLLIIDSADDPNCDLDQLFPPGERGCIIITTRNPNFGIYGTVGPKHLTMESLPEQEADSLLLRAAMEPLPAQAAIYQLARQIATRLGYLPLALVHAGKAIFKRVCSFQNYLEYYNISLNAIRQARHNGAHDSDDPNIAVYATWEVSFRDLERKGTEASADAIEVLKTLSFLHPDNISTELFSRAEAVPRLEQAKRSAPGIKEIVLQSPLFGARIFLAKWSDEDNTLPSLMYWSDRFSFRLNKALLELNQLSLVMYNPALDSYRTHALVHSWVRVRPQMTLANQVYWCNAAANILANSIEFPDSMEHSIRDADYRRRLLPHIEHLKSMRQEIQSHYDEPSTSWSVGLRAIEAFPFTLKEMLRTAKFSYVFLEAGHLHTAKDMQEKLLTHSRWLTGDHSYPTRKIKGLLALTYWQLGLAKDSGQLRREVLHSCIERLGLDHSETLSATKDLGESCWLRAQYREALELHERAAAIMPSVLGEEHEITLANKGSLGRVLSKFFRFNEAAALHRSALDNLRRTCGQEHMETTLAMDNLSMVMYDCWLHDGSTLSDEALALMDEVLSIRIRKHGREHPFTLWAMVDLAKVKSAMGYHSDAEELLRKGLPVACRNLGESHVGTLFGRSCLAEVLIRQQNYLEARSELELARRGYADMEHANDHVHPDRMYAGILLARCKGGLGLPSEGIQILDELLNELRSYETDHPFETVLLRQKQALVTVLVREEENAQSTPTDGSYSTPVMATGEFADLASMFTRVSLARRFEQPQRMATL